MITINLSKTELALDQVRKTYPKLIPADAALIVNALTLAGRHALAVHEDVQYICPDENDKLTQALVSHIRFIQETIEANAPKKVSKTAPEEEPIIVNVGLTPNYAAGEAMLRDRNDLKAKLSDILQEGVEFLYQTSDILWQIALERANWSTVCGCDISRRIRVKTQFTSGAMGVEVGTSTTKKRASKKIVEAEAVEPEPEAEAVEA